MWTTPARPCSAPARVASHNTPPHARRRCPPPRRPPPHYSINVEWDDAGQRIIGSETVTYYNNSPDSLSYLWLQLDQSIFAKDSDAVMTQIAPDLRPPPAPPTSGR